MNLGKKTKKNFEGCNLTRQTLNLFFKAYQFENH